jgi:hypothetical protein
LRKFEIGPAFVHYNPATLNGPLEAGTVLRRRAFDLKQERPVDLLDVNATILYRLNAAADLYQLARGGLGVCSSRRTSPCSSVCLRGVYVHAVIVALGLSWS